MSELTTEHLQKLADAQTAAFGTMQLTLTQLTSTVQLLFGIEVARLAQEFGVPAEDVAAHLDQQREQIVKGVHDSSLNLYQQIRDLQSKKR